MSQPPAGWTPYPGPTGTRPPPPPPSRTGFVLWVGIGGAAVVAIVLVVLLVLPSLFTPTSLPSQPPGSAPATVIRQDTDGGTFTGTGVLDHCGSGISPASSSSWICLNASVDSSAGYARGWYQFQSDFNQTGLSGGLVYSAVGNLQLAAGFASLRGECAGGAAGYARIYIFWHVWVFDETGGFYVDQSDSGYFWDSGDQSCSQSSGGALPPVTSPALYGSVSSYVSPNGYSVFNPTHQYRFTFFLGCTGEVSLQTDSPGAWLAAGCNLGALVPSQNTFVETAVTVG